jgi:hypothetical protein
MRWRVLLLFWESRGDHEVRLKERGRGARILFPRGYVDTLMLIGDASQEDKLRDEAIGGKWIDERLFDCEIMYNVTSFLVCD